MTAFDSDPTGAPPAEESATVQALRAELLEKQKEVETLTGQTQQAADTGSGDVRQMLGQLIEAQAEDRKVMAQLRAELARTRTQAPAPAVAAPSPEQLFAQRIAQLGDANYYCPGCGRTSHYERECTGLDRERPHPAIEMVSTDEVKSPPDPNDKDATMAYQNGHTAMQYSDPIANRRLLGIR